MRFLILAALLGLAFPAKAQMGYPPYSWLEHCDKDRGKCALGKKWALKDLQWINRSVNGSITEDDSEALDVWTAFPADRRGDCDDYAATKRAALIALGYPADRMRFAAGYLPSGEMHLVLEVDFEGQTYVMDNTVDRIFSADRRPYFWRPITSQVTGEVGWTDPMRLAQE